MLVGKLNEREKEMISICDIRRDCKMPCNNCIYYKICKEFCEYYRITYPKDLIEYVD